MLNYLEMVECSAGYAEGSLEVNVYVTASWL